MLSLLHSCEYKIINDSTSHLVVSIFLKESKQCEVVNTTVNFYNTKMEGKRKKDESKTNTLFSYFSKKNRSDNNEECCDDVSTMINLYFVFVIPIFSLFFKL